MASLNDFARRMDQIAVQVEGNVERALKDCARAVARSVVDATPADTGRAKSNWTAQLDAAFDGLFPARVPGSAGSTAEANTLAAVKAVEAVVDSFDISRNAEVHITNNLPYIGRLNDGHSQQAPAGFVRIAVMEGLATLKDARVLDD